MLIAVALLLLAGVVVAAFLYRAVRDPEPGGKVAMLVDAVGFAVDAHTAPGVDEVAALGCLASVMDADRMRSTFKRRQKSRGPRIEPGAVGKVINCQVAGPARVPSCADVAKAYLRAVPKPAKPLLAVVTVPSSPGAGTKPGGCSEVYRPDGSLSGTAGWGDALSGDYVEKHAFERLKGAGCPDAQMLDDFEDGDWRSCGKGGPWVEGFDGTDGIRTSPVSGELFMSSELPAPRAESQRALRFSGAGFKGWGNLLSTSFRDPQKPTDLTEFAGISFWARSAAPRELHLEFATAATVATQANGACPDKCGDHHRIPIPISPSWQEHRVPFSSHKQAGYGAPVPLDPAASMHFNLVVRGPEPFDIWIDDLRLYRDASDTPAKLAPVR